jgi:hypothetical protein
VVLQHTPLSLRIIASADQLVAARRGRGKSLPVPEISS